MIELVYIGEDLPAEAPAFVRPFQHKETDEQLSWDDVRSLMAITTVTIRPPSPEELESVHAGVHLIKACAAFLMQFSEPVQEGA